MKDRIVVKFYRPSYLNPMFQISVSDSSLSLDDIKPIIRSIRCMEAFNSCDVTVVCKDSCFED